MSVKYFTGCNNVTGGGKNQSSDTALTSLGLPETEPADTADGIDPKPNRTVDSATDSKYVRIRRKVYSKTGDTYGKPSGPNAGCIGMKGGKSRASMLKGKYNLGHMYKYRKTLKKLLSATGQAAATGTPKGERNMYSAKGNGHTGVKHSKVAAADYCVYPISGSK